MYFKDELPYYDDTFKINSSLLMVPIHIQTTDFCSKYIRLCMSLCSTSTNVQHFSALVILTSVLKVG